METSIVELAKAGYAAGTNDLYDRAIRARPSYQPHAILHIRNAIKSSQPVNIVEIGSGTGLFTRSLLAHPDWSSSVNQLKAVEPSEGMRDKFAGTIQDERVTVAEGTFDDTHIEDGWADVIIIAQAFHWCPDFDKASAEFARILKPGGIVALVWNLDDRAKAAWVNQLRAEIESHDKGNPRQNLELWRQSFSTPSYKNHFQPPEEKEWTYEVTGTLQLSIDRTLSSSSIAVASEEEKAGVVKEVTRIIQAGDGMVWVDKDKGIFEWPYKTRVVVSRKL